MPKPLPNVCDEPEPVRRAWKKIRTELGVNLLHHDRQRVFDIVAHELAEEIREETARLKADRILEPDKFRPCRDAADQIDPEAGA